MNRRILTKVNYLLTCINVRVGGCILNINNKLDLKTNKREYLDNYINIKYNNDNIDKDIEEYIKVILNLTSNIRDYIEYIDDSDYLDKLYSIINPLLESSSYNEIKNNINIKLPIARGLSDISKEYKEKISNSIKEIKKLIIYDNYDSIKIGILKTKEYTEEIINIIKELDKRVQEYKWKYNYFEYSDISRLAIKLVKENTLVREEIKNNLNEILIDEYQDISEDRYILAKNVSTVNTAKVVAVGDDWQSIFSFAGSKIEYTYNFLSYFPTAKILKISKAYRNSRQLIKYSSDFIMKNTDQISKQLLSTKENPSPIKFVFFEEGKEYQKLKELILAIHKNNKNSHILILGRTNKIIDTMYEEPELIDDMETKVKYQGYDDIDIDGMTIHKSKGLTSDEVIIIGLDSRFPKPYYGDFWLKEIYKNNWYEEKIPFAEERRLFYVALTRTKNNVYLLVNKDADNRSPFINEIYNIMINNKESI